MNRLGVVKTPPLRAVLQRQLEAVAHKIYGFLGCFARNPELFGNMLGVRKPPRLDFTVNPGQTFELAKVCAWFGVHAGECRMGDPTNNV